MCWELLGTLEGPLEARGVNLKLTSQHGWVFPVTSSCTEFVVRQTLEITKFGV